MDLEKKIKNIVEKECELAGLPLEPSLLYNPLKYMMSIGGKRLRPRLALTVFSLFDENLNDSIIKPAMALEIFHAFTLIHDDIMDKAPLRRGHETVHVKWNNNVAVLSGDVMCIKSYEYLSKAPSRCLSDVIELFTDTAVKVCEGQQYDMDFEEIHEITIDDYLKMIELKTAVLLACSAKMGALIGGANKVQSELLYDYAFKLGTAFQIMDDFLDTFGDSIVFGKEIGGDIMNNKKTWLLVEALSLSGGEDRKTLELMLNTTNINPADKISSITAIYERSGAKESALKMIKKYHKQAIEIVRNSLFTDSQINVLENFASSLLNRAS